MIYKENTSAAFIRLPKGKKIISQIWFDTVKGEFLYENIKNTETLTVISHFDNEALLILGLG